MKKYKLVAKKGEGTFSEVVEAEHIETGKFCAIKCMKKSFKSLHQVNNLREIQALRKLTPHPNIVDLEEVLFDEPTGRLAIVFELMDENLYELISGRRNHLDSELVRSIGYQVFLALRYMHSRSVFHRDIKPENILIDKERKKVKLADFGSCRGTNSQPPFTEYIATRWYRSPECLLTEGHYGAPMDVWGAGCVLFEMTSLCPLFPGADEVDQINRIHKIIGTPSRETLLKLRKHQSQKISFRFRDQKGVGIKDFIPHASLELVHLINQTLIYDVERRFRSRQAFEHKYFDPIRLDDDCISTTSIRKTLSVVSSKSMGIRKTLSVGSSKSSIMSIRRTPSVESYNSMGVKKTVSEESRNEKTGRRNRGLKNEPSGASNGYVKRRIIVEGQVETRKIVKAKPKPRSKVNNKSNNRRNTNKAQHKTEHKPTNSKKVKPDEQTDKKKNTFRSKLKFNRTKPNDETKRNKSNYNGRLQGIGNSCLPGNNNKTKVAVKNSSKIKETGGKDASKTTSEVTRQPVRKSKYSNVSSSGYGRTAYKPKHSKTSPTSSTLTEKTAQTSSQISSLSSLAHNDQVGERRKKLSPINQHRKKQPPKREDTFSKLPAVQ